MRVSKQQFLFAVRGSGGWVYKVDGKVIYKGLAITEDYCFLNDRGEFETVEKECVDDRAFILIPRICTGYTEVAFLRSHREELSGLIERYGLKPYMEADLPVFRCEDMDEAMLACGREAFSRVLMMLEENDSAMDLYNRAETEIAILREWLDRNEIELSDAD